MSEYHSYFSANSIYAVHFYGKYNSENCIKIR